MPKSFYCVSLATLGLVLLWSKEMPGGPQFPTTLTRAIEFSPDGKYVLVMSQSGAADPSIGLLDVEKRKWASVPFKVGDDCVIATAAFSPDGKMVVTGGKERMPRVTRTPGGDAVTSRGEYSTIRFWDISTGKQLRLLKTKSTRVNSLSFSAAGNYLLSAESGGLFLWDVKTGKLLRMLTEQSVTTGALSSNGRLALSDDEEEDYTVLVWDTATGQSIRKFAAIEGAKRLKGIGGNPRRVVFSPEERRVGYFGSSICIWEIKTGDLMRQIHTHGFGVESACFTPTGRFVLTAGMSQACRLWEVSTGKDVLTLKKKSGPSPSVAVSPDGKHVLYADEWESSLWDLHDGSVISVIWARSGKQ